MSAPFNGFPLHEVYSGLVRIGDAPNLTVEPELAESWSVGEDGLSYTFILREALRFSDGSFVTAEDVKWSWERALTPGYITRWSSELFGAIVGAQEMMRGRARTLAGATVVDPLTLSVQMARPTAHFLPGLASPAASVLSKENVRHWGTWDWVRHERLAGQSGPQWGQLFLELPVGTGPFRVVAQEWTNRVVLEPNPHYWRGEPEFGQLWIETMALAPVDELREVTQLGPDIDRFDVVPAESGALESVAAGLEASIDGISLADRVPSIGATAPRVSWLAFNTALPPYDNLNFRRSLSRSAGTTSDARIISILDGVSNLTATGLLPPSSDGHRPDLFDPSPERETAEEYLKSSGLQVREGPGPILEFAMDRRFPTNNLLSDLSRHWRDWLGLTVVEHTTRLAMDWEQFQSAVASDTVDEMHNEINDPNLWIGAQLAAGTLQMQYVQITPAYPDPCAILCRIPDLFGPNAQSDETRQLREMLDDAAATADRAARIAKYQAIEDHILDRALVIPVFWDDGTVYRLVKPYISGYKVPAYGGSQYEDVVVDTTHPDYPTDR